MKTRMIEKYRVVGANVKSQTISWEKEMELFDGIPYRIDPSRDFTNVYLGGYPIKDIPVNDVVGFFNPQMGVRMYGHYSFTTMEQRYWDGVRIEEEFGKIRRYKGKKRKKLEKKFWKKYWRYLFG